MRRVSSMVTEGPESAGLQLSENPRWIRETRSRNAGTKLLSLPARIVSVVKNLKSPLLSPLLRGRIYGEGWCMFCSKAALRACCVPLTQQGGDALSNEGLRVGQIAGWIRKCAKWKCQVSVSERLLKRIKEEEEDGNHAKQTHTLTVPEPHIRTKTEPKPECEMSSLTPSDCHRLPVADSPLYPISQLTFSRGFQIPTGCAEFSSTKKLSGLTSGTMTSACNSVINPQYRCPLPTLHLHPLLLRSPKLPVRPRLGLCKTRGSRSRVVMSTAPVEERSKDGVASDVQTVLIVGAGLAGLATALALHRVGVKALVLEQSGGLRTEGTSLTLFPNAWRALDALGVSDQLRGSFLNCVGGRMRTPKGKVIKEFRNSDLPGAPHELRAVERQALLRVLAKALPSDTIAFNSRVKNIRQPRDAQFVTEVELDNGTVIRTQGWT